ncbi:hypothetical protein JKP88DRAFT_289089 [Tribonema minus]|uniref:Uncharacterized protein n=1 Tax=Tribonema minus TaxID=303371 RepID=A0A835Z362_9STRA|nr:hypothetical protein JKP88DRAFT_289089 [Tribonema minus]
MRLTVAGRAGAMTRCRTVLPAQSPPPPPPPLLLLLLALLLLAVPPQALAAAVAAHGTCPERSIEPEPGVCCPASCGSCGGNDCHQLPGGSSACCPERIRAVNKAEAMKFSSYAAARARLAAVADERCASVLCGNAGGACGRGARRRLPGVTAMEAIIARPREAPSLQHGPAADRSVDAVVRRLWTRESDVRHPTRRGKQLRQRAEGAANVQTSRARVGSAPAESYGITMERYVGGLVQRFAALRREAGHAATHMVLVGDSTMRGQSFKLCRALLMAAGDARRCPPKLAAAHDGLTIEYREAKIFDAGVTGADVIYFGHALHMLHLMPAKVQPMRHVAAWLRYEDALSATVEAYLKDAPRATVEAYLKHAPHPTRAARALTRRPPPSHAPATPPPPPLPPQANDAPLIVFTLSHAVSTEGWDGAFLRALHSYEGGGGGGGSGGSSGHALCVKRFGEMAAGRWAAFSAADAQRYCREGMMTSAGTAALNVRARATIEGAHLVEFDVYAYRSWVAQARTQPVLAVSNTPPCLGSKSFPPRAVSMVDAFAITAQQTWATAPRDGRHYPDLEWMELASLLHELIEAQLARTTAAAAAAAAP